MTTDASRTYGRLPTRVKDGTWTVFFLEGETAAAPAAGDLWQARSGTRGLAFIEQDARACPALHNPPCLPLTLALS